jgi:hypothetical protein
VNTLPAKIFRNSSAKFHAQSIEFCHNLFFILAATFLCRVRRDRETLKSGANSPINLSHEVALAAHCSKN